MKKSNGIIWGIVLIALGVVWALSSFNLVNVNIFFDGWWTLFIIVPSVVSFFNNRNKTGSIIGIIAGLLLLASEQNIINYDIMGKLIVPIILIIIGINIVANNFGKPHTTEYKSEPEFHECEAGEQCTAMFSGQNINYSCKTFAGAKLLAIFGGIKCSLHGANFEKESTLDVCCIFGGCDIMIPENINVEISSFCLFGGACDRRPRSTGDENSPKIYVNAFCLFGGAKII